MSFLLLEGLALGGVIGEPGESITEWIEDHKNAKATTSIFLKDVNLEFLRIFIWSSSVRAIDQILQLQLRAVSSTQENPILFAFCLVFLFFKICSHITSLSVF